MYLVKDVFSRACAEGDTASSAPETQKHGKAEKGEIRGASSIATAYVFVEDRLRAVRQDLTVQGLGAMAESAGVLKLTANFYVIAGYLMLDQVSQYETGFPGSVVRLRCCILDSPSLLFCAMIFSNKGELLLMCKTRSSPLYMFLSCLLYLFPVASRW